MKETPVTDKRIVDWIMPGLVGLAVTLLGWIAISLSDLKTSVAVAVVRIEDHELRLKNLETLFLKEGQRP